MERLLRGEYSSVTRLSWDTRDRDRNWTDRLLQRTVIEWAWLCMTDLMGVQADSWPWPGKDAEISGEHVREKLSSSSMQFWRDKYTCMAFTVYIRWGLQYLGGLSIYGVTCRHTYSIFSHTYRELVRLPLFLDKSTLNLFSSAGKLIGLSIRPDVEKLNKVKSTTFSWISLNSSKLG